MATYFTRTCVDRDTPGRAVLDEFDDGHGRLVRRRVFVSTEAADLEALRCWPGLHAVLAVETIRSVNGTAKTVAEWRYYLNNCIKTHQFSEFSSASVDFDQDSGIHPATKAYPTLHCVIVYNTIC